MRPFKLRQSDILSTSPVLSLTVTHQTHHTTVPSIGPISQFNLHFDRSALYKSDSADGQLGGGAPKRDSDERARSELADIYAAHIRI